MSPRCCQTYSFPRCILFSARLFRRMFFSEQRFGPGDHFVPALTCRHLANKNTYPRQQPNNWFRGADANKEKRGRGGQEKPQHHLLRHTLGLRKIPLKTLTSRHYKLLCFFAETWEPYFLKRSDKSQF